MSTPHISMQFPSAVGDIVTIHVDQKIAHECYVAGLKVERTNRIYRASPHGRSTGRKGCSLGSRGSTRDQSQETKSQRREHMIVLVDLDPRLNEDHIEPSKDVCPLPLHDEEHATHIGTSLKPINDKLASQTLIDNVDLFAWTTSYMPGGSPNIITHRLSVYKEAKLFTKKKRKMGKEKHDVACKEAGKLVKAGFIKRGHYTWLSNVVMIKKSNGKWRMCTDYTKLNKACPKDSYPLPSIDCLVDGAVGHHTLGFLDAYSGYNQIQIHPRDKEKIAFTTDCVNFYYGAMSFGLKNVGATYQRLMDYVFKGILSRNIEVYVNGIVVKSNSCLQHVLDLKEVFKAL